MKGFFPGSNKKRVLVLVNGINVSEEEAGEMQYTKHAFSFGELFDIKSCFHYHNKTASAEMIEATTTYAKDLVSSARNSFSSASGCQKSIIIITLVFGVLLSLIMLLIRYVTNANNEGPITYRIARSRSGVFKFGKELANAEAIKFKNFILNKGKDAKVTIIAHSHGGMVTTSMMNLLSDKERKQIERVILLGSPQQIEPKEWFFPISIAYGHLLDPVVTEFCKTVKGEVFVHFFPFLLRAHEHDIDKYLLSLREFLANGTLQCQRYYNDDKGESKRLHDERKVIE